MPDDCKSEEESPILEINISWLAAVWELCVSCWLSLGDVSKGIVVGILLWPALDVLNICRHGWSMSLVGLRRRIESWGDRRHPYSRALRGAH